MEDKLPEGYRWGDLTAKDGIEQLNFYRELLLHLGSQEAKPLVQAIYANANTALKKPTILKKLITNIDELDWYSAKEEGLGDLYEGLLEKNATEKKSGAGQYFTPRQLIDCIRPVRKFCSLLGMGLRPIKIATFQCVVDGCKPLDLILIDLRTKI